MDTPSEKTATSSSNSKDETIIIAQQLKMQFHGTRKGDLETIDSYVKKLKSTANSLTAIGNPISDPDLVLQLLAGLPPQYLLLKNTISSQLPLPNFSEACSMLYEYEKTTSTLPPPPPGVAGENNNNSNTGKSTVEMIHDIASTVTTVASIAREFWNAVAPWSGSRSSGTPIKVTPGPGNKKNGSTGGRGNNNRGRGGGGSSSRNSAGK
ncbi:hypothetical protein AABB24_000427 [Solanum stoloniferum]|uniref:Uncharacterized protein n=2 Tax=Solanum TaxID=4107 RepID=A0AAF0PRT5_SOLVR|nr:uncharacterized protein LOC125837749 [Solanum verrucosum]WMV07586.1 hypothetical protein MTR67_000971 [Solanum verrucosum]